MQFLSSGSTHQCTYCKLNKEGKAKHKGVSVIVAMAFILQYDLTIFVNVVSSIYAVHAKGHKGVVMKDHCIESLWTQDSTELRISLE